MCNAGGAFAYVGAMHDSFPHDLELSRKGYNAFALIYRPDALKACEDLSRAIQFIFEHAKELEVDTDCSPYGVVRLEPEWQPGSECMDWMHLVFQDYLDQVQS